MLAYLFNTVAPVYLIIGTGYLLVRRGGFSSDMIDALMRFAIQVAIPCLLFRATSTLDLNAAYEWPPLIAFYASALLSFIVATITVHRWFGRRPGEAVAVGFAALFSNLVLLGLPILERALGEQALPMAYALVSLHAPFCYLVGIVAMEMLRADGRSLLATARVVAMAMFRNNLMIGIALGFLVNFSGLRMPGFAVATLDILTAAALPVALVGLGGVLTRYRLSAELREAGTVCLISLVLHPASTLLLSTLMQVSSIDRNVVVLMAAMAPGINAYLFASMYNRGRGTAASTVLAGTGIAIVSISVWLWLLQVVLA